jgi:hypothetical protein
MFSFDLETQGTLNFEPIEPTKAMELSKESIYFQQEHQIYDQSQNQPLKLSDQIFKSLNLSR